MNFQCLGDGFGYIKSYVQVVYQICEENSAAGSCCQNIYSFSSRNFRTVYRKVEERLCVKLFKALDRFQDVQIMNLIEHKAYQPVNASPGNLNACFSVKKAGYLSFRTQLSAEHISENQIGNHVVSYNEALYLSFRQLIEAEKSSRFVQGEKEEIQRNSRLYFYKGNPVVNHSISLHLNLIKGVIYCRNFFNIYGYGCQRGIAYYLVSGINAALTFKRLSDFLHLAENQTAGVGYRIVQLAPSDDYIYNSLFDFFFVVIYFGAYLLEACSFQVNALYGQEHFVGIYISAVVQLPGGSRKNIFRLKDPFESVII